MNKKKCHQGIARLTKLHILIHNIDMDSLIRNVVRMGCCGFYPLIYGIFFYLVIRKEEYLKAFKKNYKYIILNTLLFVVLGLIVLFKFFSIEDTIYSFDYAGHWIRSLELKASFYDAPFTILKDVYHSMNYQEYSSLPALILLPFMVLGGGSYLQFTTMIFVAFIIPIVILVQILYFSKTDKYPYLPFVLFVAFYPLYFIVFYGELDGVGMFFIIYSLITLFLQPFEKIDKLDLLGINLSTFILLFLRRYYLYFVFAMYVLFLIKALYYLKNHKDEFKSICWKTLQTGLYVLLVLIIFFRPYIFMVLYNNFSEAYAMYDRDNKLLGLLNNYSYLISLISLIGIYALCKAKEYKTLYFALGTTIIICLMFWRIQSFEYHHYSLISVQILILFIAGTTFILKKSKIVMILLLMLLCVQSSNIYLDFTNNPLFTSLRKTPEINPSKQALQEFSNYLYAITEGEGMYVYFATGDNFFNDDIIENVCLPHISKMPKIYKSTLDLRDGFPVDLKNTSYVVLTAPTLYLDKEYQKIYDIITHAIRNEPIVKEIYQQVHESYIGDVYVEVFKRIGEFTPEIKQYFYDEVLKIYPDHADFFANILD